jgi:hypothetical protein
MAGFGNLNLIHLLDFYLMLAFLVSTYLRFRQYRAIVGMAVAVPGRWPRLFQLVRKHRTIFLTWSTVLPAMLALSLCLLNMLACRLVWPQANLTVAQLGGMWPALPAVALLGTAMLGVDVYATFNVGTVDRQLLEKYFDQAEYWLRSWVAPVVRVFTLGYINPRQMVAVEVRAALEAASRLLNSTLWWVSVQVGLRLAFGLSLWLTYAWSQLGDRI